MRALGTPEQAKCPYCGYTRISSSLKGETQCSNCEKYFTFNKKRAAEYRQNWVKNNPHKYKERYTRHNARFKPLYEELRNRSNNKCDLCGRDDKRLEFHERKGESHPINPVYIRDHFKDFVLLCQPCHEATHWAMLRLDWDYEQFKEQTFQFL